MLVVSINAAGTPETSACDRRPINDFWRGNAVFDGIKIGGVHVLLEFPFLRFVNVGFFPGHRIRGGLWRQTEKKRMTPFLRFPYAQPPVDA